MPEYIEREAALELLKLIEYKESSINFAGAMIRALRDIPAADVRPVVRGKWITKEYMYGDPSVGVPDRWVERLAESSDYYAECSVCGTQAGYTFDAELVLSPFCPNCGARMDGDGE